MGLTDGTGSLPVCFRLFVTVIGWIQGVSLFVFLNIYFKLSSVRGLSWLDVIFQKYEMRK